MNVTVLPVIDHRYLELPKPSSSSKPCELEALGYAQTSALPSARNLTRTRSNETSVPSQMVPARVNGPCVGIFAVVVAADELVCDEDGPPERDVVTESEDSCGVVAGVALDPVGEPPLAEQAEDRTSAARKTAPTLILDQDVNPIAPMCTQIPTMQR